MYRTNVSLYRCIHLPSRGDTEQYRCIAVYICITMYHDTSDRYNAIHRYTCLGFLNSLAAGGGEWTFFSVICFIGPPLFRHPLCLHLVITVSFTGFMCSACVPPVFRPRRPPHARARLTRCPSAGRAKPQSSCMPLIAERYGCSEPAATVPRSAIQPM